MSMMRGHRALPGDSCARTAKGRISGITSPPCWRSGASRCHGEATAKGNLSLATAAAVFKGGDSGPAVVPGKPDESLLLEMISGDPPEMPKKGEPLSAAEVADLRALDRAGGALARRAWRSSDRRFEGQRGGRSGR